ncbi:hypothetical protein [Terribacillus sp. DMT04]|uniref:hypothetical protein n=1 Tax=Terribacillus sp. DMT04 TaxID=2850441 RepID=UPI001C2C9A5D|nr:hypothetical protein [Terribacillus sp. DMT04]QXE03230.1 hypothetical protein KS242_08710 [Terribacillus sp. DMT04]
MKKSTPEECKKSSLMCFIITGLLIVGYTFDFLIEEGFDESMFTSSPLFFASLIAGSYYKVRAKRLIRQS